MAGIKKIIIVVNNLSGGGVQKSAAMLSLMLPVEKYDVTYILTENIVNYSYRGDLVVINQADSFGIIDKIKGFVKFKQIIKQQEFDYILDFRGKYAPFREFLISNFVYRDPSRVIYTVRETEVENFIPQPYRLFRPFLKKNIQNSVCI